MENLIFEKCLDKIITPKKIKKKHYLQKGKFPVIAQENTLINGYSNNKSLVYKVNSPVIIFGDHTRKLKYINFDFVLGADGAKVIKPKKNINTKFFYYYLLAVMPKSVGYARHYKFLKKIIFNIPSLSKQKTIVSQLDKVFAKIEETIKLKQDSKQNLDSLYKNQLNNFFSNTKVNWENTTLGAYYDVRDGTHDSPKYVSKGFPLVTSKNLKNEKIDYNKIKYIKKEDYLHIKKRSGVDQGDVLMAMIGTIGNPVIIKGNTDFAIKNVALFKINKKQSSDFLKFFLDSSLVEKKMKKEAKGTTQQFVSLGYLRNFPIGVTSFEEQKKIVSKIINLKKNFDELSVNYKKLFDNYISFKNSLLQKLFQNNRII